jgi:hypothetical protein
MPTSLLVFNSSFRIERDWIFKIPGAGPRHKISQIIGFNTE